MDMLNTVTIQKTEYKRLKDIAKRFEIVRNTIAPEFPTEDLKEYANPQRIHRAFRNALKKYPVAQ